MTTCSGKPNPFLADLGSIIGHMTVAKMVNYTLEVLKAITKRIALAGTE